MFLYLVRHGEAKKEEEDPGRRLTDRGREDVRKVAGYAEKLDLRVSEIFHSAKPRAQQTAQILAEHLRPTKGIDQSDNLLPMDDPALWAMRIKGMNEDTMLVGHLPYLAKLAALLVTGNAEKMIIDLKMAGIVCCKRFDDGRWTLEWMIAPDMVK
jgi:phosphohistidine phosphatase